MFTSGEEGWEGDGVESKEESVDMGIIEEEVNMPEKSDENDIVMDLVNIGPELSLSGGGKYGKDGD